MQFLPATASGGGGGNATVRADAPIQPPQAFVDVLYAATGAHDTQWWDHLSGRAITSIAAVTVQDVIASSALLDLTDNALTGVVVNAILAACAAVAVPYSGSELHLEGGTNAAPSGQGLADKATLIANGWAVTTN